MSRCATVHDIISVHLLLLSCCVMLRYQISFHIVLFNADVIPFSFFTIHHYYFYFHFRQLFNFRNRFDTVADLLEPRTDGCENRCFISKSYDATSHFETAANDILNLYKRITGKYVRTYVRTWIHFLLFLIFCFIYFGIKLYIKCYVMPCSVKLCFVYCYHVLLYIQINPLSFLAIFLLSSMSNLFTHLYPFPP